MSDSQRKFQQLLRELFQFDSADPGSGSYRFMNHRQDVIARSITESLPNAMMAECAQGALADQSARSKELDLAPDGDQLIFGVEALEGVFKARMFAPVEAQ